MLCSLWIKVEKDLRVRISLPTSEAAPCVIAGGYKETFGNGSWKWASGGLGQVFYETKILKPGRFCIMVLRAVCQKGSIRVWRECCGRGGWGRMLEIPANWEKDVTSLCWLFFSVWSDAIELSVKCPRVQIQIYRMIQWKCFLSMCVYLLIPWT